MGKQVYTEKEGWIEIQDPEPTKPQEAGAPVPMANLAPVAIFEDTPEVVIDTTKLPFKRMLNKHLIVTIDKYRRSKDQKIVAPKQSERNSTKGTVLAVADDIKDIKVGDKILYSQFAGYLLVFDGLPWLRTLGYEEVLAVLSKDAPDLLLEGV